MNIFPHNMMFAFYGSIACMNTIIQLISACVRYSLQSAKNIF